MKYVIEDLDNSQESSSVNYAKKGAQFAGGLLTSAAQGVPGIIGLPGAIQEAIIGELPGPLNVFSDINKRVSIPAQKAVRRAGTAIFGDIEPENPLTSILQGVAQGVGGGGALGAGKAILGGARTLPAILGAAESASGVGALAQGAKNLPAIGQAAKAGLGANGIKGALKSGAIEAAKNPLVRDVAIGGAMHEAQDFGPIGSLTAGLGTAAGLGKLAGKGVPLTPRQYQKEINIANEYKSQLHDYINDFGSKIKVSKPRLINKLKPFKKEIENLQTGHGFTSAESTSSINNVEKLLNKMNENPKGFTASDLYNLKTDVNSVWNVKDTKAAQIQKRMSKILHEEIDKLGESNVHYRNDLHNAIRTADAIHSAESFESGLTQYFKDSRLKLEDYLDNPYAQAAVVAIPALFGGFTGAIKGLGGLVFTKGLKKGAATYDQFVRANKAVDIIKNNPKAAQVAEKLMESVGKYQTYRSDYWKNHTKNLLVKFNKFFSDESISEEPEKNKFIVEDL